MVNRSLLVSTKQAMACTSTVLDQNIRPRTIVLCTMPMAIQPRFHMKSVLKVRRTVKSLVSPTNEHWKDPFESSSLDHLQHPNLRHWRQNEPFSFFDSLLHSDNRFEHCSSSQRSFDVHRCFSLVIDPLCLFPSIVEHQSPSLLLLLGTAPTVRIQPSVITLKEGQRMIVEYTVNVSGSTLHMHWAFLLSVFFSSSRTIQTFKLFGAKWPLTDYDRFHRCSVCNRTVSLSSVPRPTLLVPTELLLATPMAATAKTWRSMFSHDVFEDKDAVKWVPHKFVSPKKITMLRLDKASTLFQAFTWDSSSSCIDEKRRKTFHCREAAERPIPGQKMVQLIFRKVSMLRVMDHCVLMVDRIKLVDDTIWMWPMPMADPNHHPSLFDGLDHVSKEIWSRSVVERERKRRKPTCFIDLPHTSFSSSEKDETNEQTTHLNTDWTILMS